VHQVEARLARRADAKAREESPDLMVAGSMSVMGAGGDDSFAAAKARCVVFGEWSPLAVVVQHR
jgi:hypothetical protein